jgi:hypothetical protein
MSLVSPWPRPVPSLQLPLGSPRAVAAEAPRRERRGSRVAGLPWVAIAAGAPDTTRTSDGFIIWGFP